jgi:hypothetical protein
MVQDILNGRVFIEPLNEILSNGVISKHLIYKPNANHFEILDI